MGDLLGMSVEELVSVLKTRRARLPFEIGAFVTLEACETLIQGPAVIGPGDVRIAEDGTVSVYAPPNSAAGADAARSIVSVLAHLLVAAGPGVPPGLLQLVEQGPSDGRWDLGRLRDELEASLIPLNRSAARRVLSRLLREVKREQTAGGRRGKDAPVADSLDSDLDQFLGDDSGASVTSGELEPVSYEEIHSSELELPDGRALGDTLREEEVRRRSTLDSQEVTADFEPRAPAPAVKIIPAEPPVSARMSPRGADPRGRGPLPDEPVTRRPPPKTPTGEAPPIARRPPPREQEAPPVARRPPPRDDEDDQPVLRRPAPMTREPGADPEPMPSPRDETPITRRGVDLDGFDESGGRGRGWLWFLLVLFVVGATVTGLALARPDVFAGLIRDVGLSGQPEPRDAGPPPPPQRPQGTLSVEVPTEDAQVLLFVGRGPAVQGNLPVGRAHEFIAIADGRAPTRAVVPPDGVWQQTPEGSLYELAMQTGEAEMRFEDLVLGPTRLDRNNMGTAGEALGRVRVITTPPNAKVYMLIGFAPAVTVRNLYTDQAYEILVWAQDYRARLVAVGVSDWSGEGEARTANVRVELEVIPGTDAERELREREREEHRQQ